MLDLAAGTGAETKDLVLTDRSVTTVEPDPGMPAELQDRVPDARGELDGRATTFRCS